MLAFGLIIVQAVLGGITVLFELPLAIAVTHAATAQALFCLMVSIAIFTNPRWETTPHVDEPPSRIPLPTLAAVDDRHHLYANSRRRADAAHERGPGDSRFSAFVRLCSCRRIGMSTSR